MTNRLQTLQGYISQLIAGLPSPTGHHLDDDDIQAHLSGVSSCCVLLALRRGLDPELAGISGMLHDIYRFKTGITPHHGHNGAEMARVVLKRMGDCFSEDEKEIILSAIFHHGEKKVTHGEYDEVLKDADTLSPFLYEGGPDYASPFLIKGSRRKRLKSLAKELGLTINFPEKKSYAKSPTNEPDIHTDKRLLLADIAERLAATSITGVCEDAVFMNLIRYWPEDTAPEELKSGWCAAFVYHCCQEAGFTLPIRWVTEGSRFAGVAAWNSWARKLGYFIKDEPGIVPKRGDIVLYRNSIPPENKPEDQRHIPIDHIGIVLAGNSYGFTVAEGNVNNENVSGILKRPHHQSIEGYIRIDNEFDYDSWTFDYKEDTCKYPINKLIQLF